MKKIIIAIIMLSLFSTPFYGVRALDVSDAYKSIVKIYTYTENESNQLNLIQSGSGIIINNEGVVLTNHHVVTAENGFEEEMPVSFKICLTVNTAEKPTCDYSGQLLAKDKSKDIALIKIKNISGLSNKASFDYLERKTASDFKEGDSVKALGYPGIGGDTLTTTAGTISGTTEKYSSSWIKTDTSFSYGSSGGALIDENGKLLGITTQAHSDFLGSLGYVIDIVSVNSWIDSNASKAAQSTILQGKMDELIIKQNKLNNSNTFSAALPAISITKASDWEFKYDEDGVLVIENVINSEGGGISLIWSDEGILQENRMEAFVKPIKMLSSTWLKFISEKDRMFNDKKAKELVYMVGENELGQILIPSKNYMIVLSYNYGENDVDKNAVDQMVNSLTISDAGNNFTETRSYQNKNPYFNISVPSNWAVNSKNSVDEPLDGVNHDDVDVSFSVYINKLTDTVKGMTNEAYFNYFKDNEMVKQDYEISFDFKADRYYETMNYALNGSIQNVIYYKYRFKDENDNDKVKAHAAGLRIRKDDKAIIIGFDYMGDDEKVFEQKLKDFIDKVLVNFDMGGQPANPANPANPTSNLQIISLTNAFSKKLIGKILLKVESKGEAWYLSSKDNKAYYLGRPNDAFQVMREQGVGISNANLNKIPVGTENMSGTDTDGDGLSDIFEDAIGTNKDKKDTDGDGYEDKIELDNGYSPSAKNIKLSTDKKFSDSQKGKIFLQVEGKGEAWYINPSDGKRYFLGRPSDAYNLMRNLGIGISNNDFDKIN